MRLSSLLTCAAFTASVSALVAPRDYDDSDIGWEKGGSRGDVFASMGPIPDPIQNALMQLSSLAQNAVTSIANFDGDKTLTGAYGVWTTLTQLNNGLNMTADAISTVQDFADDNNVVDYLESNDVPTIADLLNNQLPTRADSWNSLPQFGAIIQRNTDSIRAGAVMVLSAIQDKVQADNLKQRVQALINRVMNQAQQTPDADAQKDAPSAHKRNWRGHRGYRHGGGRWTRSIGSHRSGGYRHGGGYRHRGSYRHGGSHRHGTYGHHGYNRHGGHGGRYRHGSYRQGGRYKRDSGDDTVDFNFDVDDKRHHRHHSRDTGDDTVDLNFDVDDKRHHRHHTRDSGDASSVDFTIDVDDESLHARDSGHDSSADFTIDTDDKRHHRHHARDSGDDSSVDFTIDVDDQSLDARDSGNDDSVDFNFDVEDKRHRHHARDSGDDSSVDFSFDAEKRGYNRGPVHPHGGGHRHGCRHRHGGRCRRDDVRDD